jgi:signal transduction histidine kinase
MKRFRVSAPLRAAARVAGVTTLVAALVYAAVGVSILGIAQRYLTDAVDAQLNDVTGFFQRNSELLVGGTPFNREPDPSTFSNTYGWFIVGGQVLTKTQSAPDLPASLFHVSNPVPARVGGHSLHLAGGRIAGGQIADGPYVPSGWVVVGESTHFIDQTVFALLVAEAVLGAPLLALIFLVALAIGRLSAAPIERARRQLLSFTADASHELRTPLQVIEAEVSLALQRERNAESYQGSLKRVQAESARLRRLVEDLLWLARFDNQPQAPPADLVDLRAVATDAAERFEAVARRRGQTLELRVGDAAAAALISAPNAWIERLFGVLLDNACRYSPEGGSVRLLVEVAGSRARVAVEDSGPGIPAAERKAIFERFHRATDQAGGAGLGLAIGNAVVQTTSGRWEISDVPGGGARVAVSWELTRRPRPDRRRETAPSAAPLR